MRALLIALTVVLVGAVLSPTTCAPGYQAAAKMKPVRAANEAADKADIVAPGVHGRDAAPPAADDEGAAHQSGGKPGPQPKSE